MSEEYFSRRAFRVALVIVPLILLSFFSVGASTLQTQCNSVLTTMQCGTASCTITNFTCIINVTFPTAFLVKPTHISVAWAGHNEGVNHAEVLLFIGTSYFESDNGTTWRNMPVAATELYGNTNHQTRIPVQGGASLEGLFFATCIKGSSSNTATLRPMYRAFQGDTMHELALNTGVLDINIAENNQLCQLIEPFVVSSGLTAFANAFSPSMEITVEGFNGGGAGDNPILNNIGLAVYEQFFEVVGLCVNLTSACNGTGLIASSTTFQVTATVPFIPISGTLVNLEWQAWI